MRRNPLIFGVLFFLTACSYTYEREEFKAIEDISNDYLSRNDLSKILNERSFGDSAVPQKINIDSLDLKVYFSNALMPISQVKEDDEWMFIDNNFSVTDSVIFYSITNSKKFHELS